MTAAFHEFAGASISLASLAKRPVKGEEVDRLKAMINLRRTAHRKAERGKPATPGLP